MAELTNKDRALVYAGMMADYALLLVGGKGLNGDVPAAHPDDFSEKAKNLRHAAEQYNYYILSMLEGGND